MNIQWMVWFKFIAILENMISLYLTLKTQMLDHYQEESCHLHLQKF